MKLIEKFINLIKKELNYFGISSFDELSNNEIIALILNIKSKIILETSYVVKESPEVLNSLSLLDDRFKDAYNTIKFKLKHANNVTPFLSKQAIKPKFQDYLLLDWNIHHFHLNMSNTGNYFNERSDYLLMVLFQNNIAHFIDIEHHNDDEVFVKREYLKILKDNWSEIIEPYELKGVLDISIDPTNQQIKEFRKNQINTCVKIDDKVYCQISGGINTAGTGANHTIFAIKWEQYINSIEKKYKEIESTVLNDIFIKTDNRYKKLDLDFDYHNNHLVLIDKNSNLVIESMNI